MRRVYHQCCLGHGRISSNMPHETLHAGCAVEHRVVHVDVDDSRSVLYLGRCYPESFLVISRSNQLGEFPRAGHVRPFPDVGEIAAVQVHHEMVESADLKKTAAMLRDRTRSLAGDDLADGCNVLRSRSAASSYDVQYALGRHSRDTLRHLLRSLVISSHFVGKSGIRIADDRERAETGHFFHEWQQVLRSQ